jgi:hypothetical protein
MQKNVQNMQNDKKFIKKIKIKKINFYPSSEKFFLILDIF